jgi:uncharacterized damage-inducible protein DinB
MTPTELYAYHRWANRRLFDVASALGEETCGRDVGAQFSLPTLRGMFAHIYGADALWLARWKGLATGAWVDVATMAALRKDWDALEVEQQAWVEALKPVDLGREMHYNDTAGNPYHAPLGVLLTHVVTHGNHHRSEIATMLTMLSDPPPDTGLVRWHRTVTGQLRQPGA